MKFNKNVIKKLKNISSEKMAKQHSELGDTMTR